MEAAIVLPIFILIVCSIVYLTMHFFGAMNDQIQVQREIVDSINNETAIYKRIEISNSYSSRIGGFNSRFMTKDYTAYKHAIDEGRIIRAGTLIGIFT